MVYFFKLFISKSLNWIVNKDRLNYFFGLKTLFLSKIGNSFVKSGNESLLKEPAFPKNNRLVILIMNKIIKLIHIDGFILNLIHNIAGNSIYVIWVDIRIFIFPRVIITRQSQQLLNDMQHSTMSLIEKQKNLGYPTSRKIHGYGAFVVGSSKTQLFFYYQREAGFRFLSEKPRISSKECARLVSLRKVNFENKSYVNKNTIHVISDVNVLLSAYALIKRASENLAFSVDGFTLNELEKTCLQNIITKIKSGKFLFSFKCKKWTSKLGSVHKRPLNLVDLREEVVQKSISLVLESIFDPSFLYNSHGFRPHRGSHTALKMIKREFHQVFWVIEGDTTECLEKIDHAILLRFLNKRISCDKTLTLIKRALAAGFINLDKFTKIKLSISQGSILGPILCNIYLHELDLFLRQLKTKFGKSTCIAKNPANLNFCKIYFVRHTNNFIVGVASSYDDVLKVENIIKDFLYNSLKLKKIKIQITYIKEKDIFFLGTFIKSNWKEEKYTRFNLHAPIKNLFDKATTEGFFRKVGINYKPTFVGKLINMDHADILDFYNSIVKRVVDYYFFVDNYKSLGAWIYCMRLSCARTLALKYKLRSVVKLFKKFGSNLACPNTHKKFIFTHKF
uniref:Reverse transcriptase domain-containing protein n=1 Tax=Pyropia kanakaensis TaxID=139729 RepID=A0A060DCN4_9RHOD|nr:hypothetical protein GU34_p10 [Pyropia kanakaensis]AIB08211.1 hypothetical protein [Pyropia kanakaensis]